MAASLILYWDIVAAQLKELKNFVIELKLAALKSQKEKVLQSLG